MKKRLLYAFIFVGILAQFGALISNIVLHEVILSKGTVHRFQTTLAGIFYAFSGRYVNLYFRVFAEDFSSDMDIPRRVKWCYLQIGTDADGFSVIERFSLKNDVPSPYLKVRAYSSTVYKDEINSEGKITGSSPTGKYIIHFYLPENRYYMPERLAPQAEGVYEQYEQAAESDEHNTVAVVRLWNGMAVVEDLEIDGVPIREVLMKH